mmetsp:Transcript_5768/g.8375  ORF Transcript_5768/g.8375 Transcript_5768/m.8375 type:complete len:697 (-) Transcript_5768:145-2235(-)
MTGEEDDEHTSTTLMRDVENPPEPADDTAHAPSTSTSNSRQSKVSFDEYVLPTTAINTGNNNNNNNNNNRRNNTALLKKKYRSIRHDISFSEENRKFNIKTLPLDMQRVYQQLAAAHGEEYGLVWIFSMRTAVELHRGWHMPLLTSRILQQIKQKFGLRTTWNLGVVKLIFRVDDGAYEIHRKVPYDYDSEFQDLYTKTAAALVGGKISVDEALMYQTEIREGKHTAKSGLLLQRKYPGRLLLYPWQASTCAIIFFGGGGRDAGVAAICGFVAGCLEWGISTIGGDFTILNDIIVGTSCGIIASLFYEYVATTFCLKSIFLGTLYWFFYGTAFVIGILEIISGELETGVTRFVGVMIKTFVLSLGATLGMSIILTNPYDVYYAQEDNCNRDTTFTQIWYARIIMYLLCSGAALAQYRFPLVNYWRGLLVQLAGYEVQYQLQGALRQEGHLDNAISNIGGAVAAVVVSEVIAWVVDNALYHYNARILFRNKKEEEETRVGAFFFNVTAFFVRWNHWFRLGKKDDYEILQLCDDKLRQQRTELYDTMHSREQITLSQREETLLLDAIISSEPVSTWSILMPAVYQLVPGSIIANLWFHTIFPPKPSVDPEAPPYAENVFSSLMVISTSLALGIIIGYNITRFAGLLLEHIFFPTKDDDTGLLKDDRKTVMAYDDPRERHEESLSHIPEEEEEEPRKTK